MVYYNTVYIVQYFVWCCTLYMYSTIHLCGLLFRTEDCKYSISSRLRCTCTSFTVYMSTESVQGRCVQDVLYITASQILCTLYSIAYCTSYSFEPGDPWPAIGICWFIFSFKGDNFWRPRFDIDLRNWHFC